MYDFQFFLNNFKVCNRKSMEKAVLGGGCFWCVEALLKNLKGVKNITPGYCGGKTAFPTYVDVKKGGTQHIEVIQVVYNPSIITFEQLFEVFMNIHDPTQDNGQGEDIGSQYISAIFYQDEEQRQTAMKIINKMNQQVRIEGKRIYTAVYESKPFYEAEQYHKNYFEIRGSQNPYCDIIPGKIAKMKHLFKELCN